MNSLLFRYRDYSRVSTYVLNSSLLQLIIIATLFMTIPILMIMIKKKKKLKQAGYIAKINVNKFNDVIYGTIAFYIFFRGY